MLTSRVSMAPWSTRSGHRAARIVQCWLRRA